MIFIYVIYILFCFGFGMSYGYSIKNKGNRFGVSLIGAILTPLIIGVMIHEYLTKDEIEDE